MGTPLYEFGAVFPMTNINTVVKAVLKCIEDESVKGIKKKKDKLWKWQK